MSLFVSLIKLKDIENSMAELYQFASKRLARIDDEAADLFKILASEEIMHAKRIEYVINFAKQSPESFTENFEHSKPIDDTLAEIKENIIKVKEIIIPMSLLELVDMAIDLENDMENKHLSLYYNVADENLKNLFTYLNQEDSAHLNKLKTKKVRHSG